MENQKVPLYVTIYGKIYNMIKEGVYKSGEQLPGEHDLAELFGISRGTLRQALLLLQEDGLVTNHQGKGNFITPNTNIGQEGLEQLGNLHRTFCTERIDDMEVALTFQLSTQKQEEALELKQPQVLAVLDIRYLAQGTVKSHAMVFIPYEKFNKYEVPLKDKEAIMTFYDHFLVTKVSRMRSTLKVVKARESTADRMGISPGDMMIMMEEVMYAENGVPLGRQKTFFAPESYEFILHRK